MRITLYKLTSKICFTLLVIMLFISGLKAQEENEDGETVYELDPVVITASRIPSLLSELGQSIEVLTAEQIKEIPVKSVDELLQLVGGMDVRERGPGGVQSDVSIRGSSFEQTLVLVDGMAMSDPQTGHHNMNLPVNLDDIERIEIVKGAASRVFGPNAMGGVINIITKKEQDFSVDVYGKYGYHNYRDLGLAIPFKIMDTNHRFSIDHKRSDGYLGTHLNDFKTTTLHYGFLWQPAEGWNFNLGGGYTDRDFGAYKYYFTSIPLQREATKTLYTFEAINYDDQHFYLHQKSYYRQGDDRFSYPLPGDSQQINNTHTRVYGGQIDFGLNTPFGKSNFGINYGNEEMNSNALGDDDRYRFGYTLEHRLTLFKKLNLGAGITGLNYEDYGSDLWPGFDFTWSVARYLDIHGSVDKGFRMPSFTELYYSDPGNVGNRHLEPESTVQYEIGTRYRRPGFNIESSVFHKNGHDIIDWVKESDSIYYVRNFAEVQFYGYEGGMEFYPNYTRGFIRLNNFFLNYTYLKSDLDDFGHESKYVLNNLRHQLNAGVTLNYFTSFYHWISIKYNQRVDDSPYTVIDNRLGYKTASLDIYIEATNILDQVYFEAGFAKMPGRWIIAGIQFHYGGEE